MAQTIQIVSLKYHYDFRFKMTNHQTPILKTQIHLINLIKLQNFYTSFARFLVYLVDFSVEHVTPIIL